MARPALAGPDRLGRRWQTLADLAGRTLLKTLADFGARAGRTLRTAGAGRPCRLGRPVRCALCSIAPPEPPSDAQDLGRCICAAEGPAPSAVS